MASPSIAGGIGLSAGCHLRLDCFARLAWESVSAPWVVEANWPEIERARPIDSQGRISYTLTGEEIVTFGGGW